MIGMWVTQTTYRMGAPVMSWFITAMKSIVIYSYIYPVVPHKAVAEV